MVGDTASSICSSSEDEESVRGAGGSCGVVVVELRGVGRVGERLLDEALRSATHCSR